MTRYTIIGSLAIAGLLVIGGTTAQANQSCSFASGSTFPSVQKLRVTGTNCALGRMVGVAIKAQWRQGNQFPKQLKTAVAKEPYITFSCSYRKVTTNDGLYYTAACRHNAMVVRMSLMS